MLYSFVCRRWFWAKSGSRAEKFWYAIRRHLTYRKHGYDTRKEEW